MISGKVFPDTEAYIIAFEAGASGNFIKTLVYQFLYGQLPYINSTYGKSHNFYNKLRNYDDTIRMVMAAGRINSYDHSQPAEYVTAIEPFNYLSNNPRDPLKPFVTAEHLHPDFEKLFYKFPKAKALIITVPNELGPRVGGNIFYKTMIDDYETNKWYKERWIRYKVENPELADFSHPQDVPIDLIEMVTKRYTPLITEVVVPEQYVQNVFIITLKELLYDKDKILNIIKNMTNKPITSYHRKYYDSYLEKQKELVANHMPWVTI
jgi:hypothetical protein